MTTNRPNNDLTWFTQMQTIVEAIALRVDSNAQAIEALSDRVREIAEEAADERAELREAVLRVTNLAEGIANLTSSLDDDRPTILGRLSRIENKVDKLLENQDL